MLASDFDYALPPESIAQVPIADRSAARMLVAGEPVQHRTVADLPELVGPGDVVVVNNTRVLPARLKLRKATGGQVEVFLLAPIGDGAWEALVRPSRRVPEGTELFASDAPSKNDGLSENDGAEAEPVVTVHADRGEGRRVVAPATGSAMLDLAAQVGAVPLPPYITEQLDDPDRYQTVYAENPASVAAPTAGLHFTPEVLAACEKSGAQIVPVELQVGIGTFRPITATDISEHHMHAERYIVPESTWQACASAERVIAVGTTSVRALESAAATGELTGDTELFIHPGYEWSVVDALLTNFHMPRSSLLVMLSAFCGPRWRELYELAVTEGYRFLSFGDAMFVERSDDQGDT